VAIRASTLSSSSDEAEICLTSGYDGQDAKQVQIRDSTNNIGGVPMLPFAKNQKISGTSHLVASSLSIGIFGLLVYDLVLGQPTLRSFYGILGVIYMIEAFLCSTRRYLSNTLSPVEVLETVQHLMEAPPFVRWKLECYHYRYGRKGETRKIVTHRAFRDFDYGSWHDCTDTQQLQKAMEYQGKTSEAFFLKITMVKLLLFANPETIQSYREQENAFFWTEGQRDQHTDKTTYVEVEGFKPKLLAVRTVMGAKGTGNIRVHFFWLFTLLGLTVPYRMWFARHCDRVELLLAKIVTAPGQ
jgi:hypothetical protein